MAETSIEQPRLSAVVTGIARLADFNRADCLLYVRGSDGHARVVAQAQPHSVPPVHSADRIGERAPEPARQAIERVFTAARRAEDRLEVASHRSPVVQRVYPVVDGGSVIAVLSIEKSLVEHERHATRRDAFRRALHDLREMVLRGETTGWETLPPFRETDGIMLVNRQWLITYMSGLGSYHYRQLGYYLDLIGRPLSTLDTADAELVGRAFREGAPFVEERLEEERIWLRTLLPLNSPRYRLPLGLGQLGGRAMGPRRRDAVLVAIHDATSSRRKEQERRVRRAMVQEIHHRVKNNLQTVASLLRIQARRAEHEETRQVLHESINRILSIAVVHEFLSQHERSINSRDVASRIAQQVRESVLGPERSIALRVDGDAVFLGAQRTTMLALVINELLLNALEHGFGDAASGEIQIEFVDHGDTIEVAVRDSGAGLPSDFELAQASSLGLRIVQTIVEGDLRGRFALEGGPSGTCARVRFPKGEQESITYEPV